MTTDEKYMRRALDLALLGGVEVAPNPMVGAVIVHEGKIIGEGYHMKFGEAHAEVNAVNAVNNHNLLKEATIYVTLEPCAHTGKTPPCAHLLVEKQFKRVVVATIDTFGKVAGKGIEKLKAAGIEVTLGVLEEEARRLNKRFFHFHENQRPYIVLKWAQSADGYIDIIRTENEKGIHWISAPETQVFTHQLRATEPAILVGWKTVEVDNPNLDVRAVSGKNPLRIVLDQHLKAPANARLFTDGRKTLVLNRVKTENQGAVEYLKMEDWQLSSLLHTLYLKGVLSVLIEGGKTIHEAFIESGLWNEAVVIVGQNKLMNGLRAPILPQVNDKEIRYGVDRILFYTRKS